MGGFNYSQTVNKREDVPLFCSHSALFCFPLHGLCFHLSKKKVNKDILLNPIKTDNYIMYVILLLLISLTSRHALSLCSRSIVSMYFVVSPSTRAWCCSESFSSSCRRALSSASCLLCRSSAS